ncbi:hypothetical protein [Solihabitans fulvus]|uniref:hypothetical protein n=1 Tax=Solihabitans fulvus TaxID=1892852 RepID=UPI001CB76760|nr:hypothetical protein [Solihabitans fulvus]
MTAAGAAVEAVVVVVDGAVVVVVVLVAAFADVDDTADPAEDGLVTWAAATGLPATPV